MFPFVAIVLTCVVTKYTSLYLVHLFVLINFYSIRACPVEFMLRWMYVLNLKSLSTWNLYDICIFDYPWPHCKSFCYCFCYNSKCFCQCHEYFLWGWIFNSFCKLVKFTCEDLSKRVFLHSSLVTRGKASLDLLRTKRAALPKSSVAYHLSDIWSRCQLPTIIINIMIIYVSESFFRNCWKWQMLFAHLKL